MARIGESSEERVGLLLLLGMACGIPVVSRWRSGERERLRRRPREKRASEARPRLARVDDRVDGAQLHRRFR
jgi:hypothetical protein